jgi:UDP-3-O-[3-hydroxymyristoyl] N-acetylglucosamine deacetylase
MGGLLQTTLQRSTAALTGPRLDQELPATLRVHPAPVDSGIAFVRADLAGAPRVPCALANLREQSRWSSIEADGAWVHHTEHILAALHGCGVTNALIELDCDRVPVLGGGSCAPFARAVRAAGVVEQAAPRQVYRLTRPVHLVAPLDPPRADAPPASGRERRLIALPADALAVSYVFQVPAVPQMRAGLCEWQAEATSFDELLAPARTYYLHIERPHVAGMLSSAQRDYIVLDETSPQELVDEVARHKTVDLLGDLYLLGRPLLGRIAAWRTGHRFHHEFLRQLFQQDAVRLDVLGADAATAPHGGPR